MLPPDIEQVWGKGRKDSSGMVAADTAEYLIGVWGLEGFRRSALHQAAVAEVARRGRLEREWNERHRKPQP